MPTPTEVGGPAGLNALWRNSLYQPLNAADVRSLAAECGVTPRTVMRWITQAGQQRNPFPQRLADVAMEEWPESYTERAQITLNVAYGWESRVIARSALESFQQRESTVGNASAWVRDLLSDELDPWLTMVWRAVSMSKGLEAWVITVIYERAAFSPSGPVVGHPGAEPEVLAPPDDPQSASFLYPETLPLVPGSQETGE